MSTRLPPVDVVMVGFGWTGAIMGEQLTAAGLQVLALERSDWRDTPTDFATTFDQDELRYLWRHSLFQNVSQDTLTIRNNTNQEALPMRRLGSFLLGTGVGGSGVHWNAQIWRFLPTDFTAYTHNKARYGKAAVEADDMSIQDWGVTYDELEPHYEQFDRICGTTGKAGNLRGAIQPGGNPFEGARANEYPNPPMQMTYAPMLFAQGAIDVGRHPFPHPTGNMSRPYTNPLGVQLGPCTYCGFCEKFACGNYSKASAQTTILPALMTRANFALRTGAEVLKVNLDSTGKQATGVTYVDAQGQEFEQPADIVLLTAYVLQNVRLLLLSGIGKPYDAKTGEGLVGKNYAYQCTSSVNLFFDNKELNPFIGAGALGMVVDDFNGDNFDHAGLNFLGGGAIWLLTTGGRPIELLYAGAQVPTGVPKWGAAWKDAVVKNYRHTTTISTHGGVMSHRGNSLDLDPTYRDIHGRPMLRMTFDFGQNELTMSKYLTDRAAEIGRAMNPREMKVNPRTGSWNVVPYQTTHNTGGAIMGESPATSVINKFSQSWDVPNLFVLGAGAFPQNPGYNPTATVAALAYLSAEAIRTRYIKSPGPLVAA